MRSRFLMVLSVSLCVFADGADARSCPQLTFTLIGQSGQSIETSYGPLLEKLPSSPMGFGSAEYGEPDYATASKRFVRVGTSLIEIWLVDDRVVFERRWHMVSDDALNRLLNRKVKVGSSD
jgi:hypothetical protein